MDSIKRFSLRMPTKLHAALVKLAKAEHRSLHAHILYMLSQARKQAEKTEKAGGS